MVFSSAVFLFLFLPLTLVGYYLLPRRARNPFLLAASLLFYAWGEPWFVFIMIASILMNYGFGLLVDRFRENATQSRVLTAMVLCNLALFFVFKYLNFTIENLNHIFRGRIPQTSIVLPIGISFFTFQAMSYVFDVAREKGEVQKNPLNVALYVALFPQLIAGPICPLRNRGPGDPGPKGVAGGFHPGDAPLLRRHLRKKCCCPTVRPFWQIRPSAPGIYPNSPPP